MFFKTDPKSFNDKFDSSLRDLIGITVDPYRASTI